MSTITYRGQDYDRALVNTSINRIAFQHNGAITREFPTGVKLNFPILLDAVEFVKTCGVADIAALYSDSFNAAAIVSLTHLGYLIGADEMNLPI